MNIVKTKTKTILTVTTTLVELKADLKAYQTDMIAEMVSDFRAYDGGPLTFQNAAKIAAICFHQGKDFYDLVEKTGTCWLDTPKGVKGWVDLVTNYPFVFGLTDQLVTKDVDVVILVLDGGFHDISETKNSVW